MLSPLTKFVELLASESLETAFGNALEQLQEEGIRGGMVYRRTGGPFEPQSGSSSRPDIPIESELGDTLLRGSRWSEEGRLYLPLLDGDEVVGAAEIEFADDVRPGLVELLASLVELTMRRATSGKFVDPSDGRQLERLVQRGKYAALGELAAGVAHEINNPLFAILSMVEFLLEDAEPGTKAHKRLALIQQTGLEIKEIVRALLEFARERADEHLLLSLEEITRKTVELVRRTSLVKDVEIVERYDAGPTLVRGSAGQLKQILLALVTNAQHAVSPGGVITLELSRENGRVSVTVTDTGPGIEEALLLRIFEPFFTTKRALGGTGLGLSVSLGIAKMHGGELIVASPPGGGASFTLELPAAQEGDA